MHHVTRTTESSQPKLTRLNNPRQPTAKEDYYNHLRFLEKVYGATPIQPETKQHRRKRFHQKQHAKSHQLFRSITS
jgi:hypothetical protein